MACLQHKRPLCCRPRSWPRLIMLLCLGSLWKGVACQRMEKDVDTGPPDTQRDHAPVPRKSKLLICFVAITVLLLFGQASIRAT